MSGARLALKAKLTEGRFCCSGSGGWSIETWRPWWLSRSLGRPRGAGIGREVIEAGQGMADPHSVRGPGGAGPCEQE